MRLPRARFTVRRMMGVVAVVAVIMPPVLETFNAFSSMPFMPRVSLLKVGEQVVTCRRARVTTTEGEYDLPAGVRCVVVSESAWDEDSCYTGRPTRIRLLDGPHRGEIVDVGRDKLWKRPRWWL